MDISFQDPTAIPPPPADVRIRDLRAELYADGRRVKVTITLTAFQKRPSLTLEIHDALGQLVAEAEVIETMLPSLALTLHLRPPDARPPFTLTAILFYTSPMEPESVTLPERSVVDTASC